MPEAAIPLVAEEAVGATAAEIAAEQAAQAAAAEAAAQAAAQAAAEQAAAQAAAQAAEQAAAQEVTNNSVRTAITQTPVSPPGTGGVVDLGFSPEVLQQLQALKGPLELPPNVPPVDTTMRSFGEVVNPYEAVPPTAPPVAGPPAAPPAAPFVPPAEPVVEAATVNPVNLNSQVINSSMPPPMPPNTAVGLAGSPAGTTLGTGADAGIQALAKQVGIETPTAFNAAEPFANPTMMPSPATPPAAPNFTSAPTLSYPPSGAPPAGADQLTQLNVRSALTNEGMNPGVYQEAVAKTPFSTVGNTPTQFAGNTSNFGANPVEHYTPYDQSFGANNRIPTETGGLYGAQTGVSTTLPTELGGTATAAAPEASGLQGLWNDFKAMPLKDKALTGMMASSAYEMLNRPKPYEPKKYKSTWNAGAYSGYQPVQPTPYRPNYAAGGLADLGGYSDGGRMLKGPGDGMSDDIPATIANKQPARLANEEFVIPADVVSHLGNGSSEAGAKQLYKMMDRVRQARTGTKKQGKQIKPEKYLA